MLRKDFDEILTSELFSVSGGVIAGMLLSFTIDKLYLFPSLFILFPGFMEMRGNISGSISARLTSGLFVGVMKYGHERDKIITGNVLASMALVVILSLLLGVIAYLIGSLIFGVTHTSIILVALMAGLLSNIIEIPITILTTLWLFKHGHDPSNIMGPYVTTIGDVISVLSLLIAIWVIG